MSTSGAPVRCPCDQPTISAVLAAHQAKTLNDRCSQARPCGFASVRCGQDKRVQGEDLELLDSGQMQRQRLGGVSKYDPILSATHQTGGMIGGDR